MLDKHLIAHTHPLALKENTFVQGDVRITVLDERLFRIEKGTFCDEATQAVWFRNMPQQDFSARVEDGLLVVETRQCKLVIHGDDLTGYVRMGGKNVPLTGEGNLLGTYRTLDCCDGATFSGFDGKATYEIQLENGVCSRTGVAMYDDSQSLLLREDGTVAPRLSDAKDLYVFAYGHDYRAAVRALFMIMGATPMIPRFALGNWWSRYYAYTDQQYINLLDRFTDRDVPLTVATVDMDWHWSTTLDERKQITQSGKNDELHGGADGWTGYSWNTDLIPDYKAFLQQIKARGLKVTLNLHPALGVRWFEDMYQEMCHEMGIDPSQEQQIKFDMTDERFLNAYFKVLHKPYERDGVDFWWIDWQQGSNSALAGLDPLWMLNHYHTLDIAKEKEPLILSRYCGLGSHRYPLGFSGDTYVTWKTLRYLPTFTANASNAGYGWWSHDIGGHMFGVTDNELYVRFLQFGVFSPINRLHCTCSPVLSKEPLVYMNGSGKIAEEFLRLRHRMIPLLYSASVEASEKGNMLIEPMYYEYPEQKAAYACSQQYLFARQMIVAPICEKTDASGMASIMVWLPEGRWTDLFTGDEYEGGRKVRMYRWLDSLPVLAREGAVIPLDGKTTGNSIDLPESLDVMLFTGNGDYTLHEDQNGARLDTVFHTEACENGFTVDINAAFARKMKLRLRNIGNGVVSVTSENNDVPFVEKADDCLMVTFDVQAGKQYHVAVQYSIDEQAKRLERLVYNLTRFEIDNGDKCRLYDAMCEAAFDDMAKTITDAPIPKRCKGRLAESLKLRP